jgi:hypothetical protein
MLTTSPLYVSLLFGKCGILEVLALGPPRPLTDIAFTHICIYTYTHISRFGD